MNLSHSFFLIASALGLYFSFYRGQPLTISLFCLLSSVSWADRPSITPRTSPQSLQTRPRSTRREPDNRAMLTPLAINHSSSMPRKRVRYTARPQISRPEASEGTFRLLVIDFNFIVDRGGGDEQANNNILHAIHRISNFREAC